MPVKIYGDAMFSRGRANRMRLRRWWVERPKRWIAWMMLNPSTAGTEKNDATMHRVIHFSRAWGYDGCIVVNLYPFIASDPRDMWRKARWLAHGPDWETRDDLMANLEDIERAGRIACRRMVAFGADVREPLWVERCIEAFTQPYDYPRAKWEFDEELWCLGVTKSGQPIHPLARGKMRVVNHAEPVRFRP